MTADHLTRKCIVCQGDFVIKTNNRRNAKYCSRKCQRQSLKGKATGSKQENACLECGKKFSFYPSQGQGKFCSRACRNLNWTTPNADRGFEDLTGREFGRWMVCSLSNRRGAHLLWNVQCCCPDHTKAIVSGSSLKSGSSRSCGCIARGVGVPKPATKTCRFCKREFAYTDEFFVKSSLYRWGLRPCCKTCWHPIARSRHLRWRRKLKLEVLSQYGGGSPRCSCCGIDFIEFLTIDHVNNDGSADRVTRGSGTDFYALLKREGYPNNPPLTVLCFNCNIAKAVFGRCPHNI